MMKGSEHQCPRRKNGMSLKKGQIWTEKGGGDCAEIKRTEPAVHGG